MQAAHWRLRVRGSKQYHGSWIKTNRILHGKRGAWWRLLSILRYVRRSPNQEQRMEGHPLRRGWLPEKRRTGQ
jgi:hypothetical protein